MGFSRQEYWSRLSFPPPGHLLDPGIEPTSLALAGGFFLPLSPQGRRHGTILTRLSAHHGPVGTSGKRAHLPVPETQDVGLIPGLGRSLEEEMATHSSTLAWRIPWAEEPGGLQSMGLHSHT